MTFLVFYLVGVILSYAATMALQEEFISLGRPKLNVLAAVCIIVLSWIGFAVCLQLAITFQHRKVFSWRPKF